MYYEMDSELLLVECYYCFLKKKEKMIYEEFLPFLFAQVKGKPMREFGCFNDAVKKKKNANLVVNIHSKQYTQRERERENSINSFRKC